MTTYALEKTRVAVGGLRDPNIVLVERRTLPVTFDSYPFLNLHNLLVKDIGLDDI